MILSLMTTHIPQCMRITCGTTFPFNDVPNANLYTNTSNIFMNYRQEFFGSRLPDIFDKSPTQRLPQSQKVLAACRARA